MQNNKTLVNSEVTYFLLYYFWFLNYRYDKIITKSAVDSYSCQTGIHLKENKFQLEQVYSAECNKKAHEPTGRTKCILTALQGDAHS